ncbi:MAG TPA: type II secretion system F family protein [Candidatus Hydrogenedentes bacterium]|nr:type II secretion system F family protein [Candidatus Hydrogenedentota bacterium]HOS03560.1 type II secretion system F family protein [Candidatus Hydrogenedentota bacterium]
MQLFRYRAVDADGRVVKGEIEESTQQRVAQMLQEQGLQVSKVEPVIARLGYVRQKQRLTWEDLELFNEQMLAITRSGLPLAPSIAALARDVTSRKLRTVLEDMHEHITHGSSLEEALMIHESSFPPVYISMVRAGERTGNLPGVFATLVQYSQRMASLRDRMQMALAYPAIVSAVALGVLLLLAWKVLPEYRAQQGLLLSLGESLTGRTTLPFFRFFPIAGAVFGLVITAGLLSGWGMTGPRSLPALDWFKARLPVLGRMHRAVAMARFTRTLGMLASSDVPILDALDIAAETAGDRRLRAGATMAISNIELGAPVGESLQETGRFERAFCWMLGSAEERGDMADTLLFLAEGYERRVANYDRFAGAALAPVLLIVIAVTVGAIAVSIYLPTFLGGNSLTGMF